MLFMNLLGSMFLLLVGILTYSVRFDISVIAFSLAAINFGCFLSIWISHANSYTAGYMLARNLHRQHKMGVNEVEQMLVIGIDDVRLTPYGRGFAACCYEFLERQDSIRKEAENEFFNPYSQNWGRCNN